MIICGVGFMNLTTLSVSRWIKRVWVTFSFVLV